MWILMLYVAWGATQPDWTQVAFESEGSCSRHLKNMRIENPEPGESQWVTVAFCRPAKLPELAE